MSPVESDERPLILVTLCGGGWHRQTYRLLDCLASEEFRFAYAYGRHSGVHGAGRLPMPHPGERYPIYYLGPTRRSPSRFIANPLRLAWSFVEALRLMRRLRPDAVLAVGTAIAVPLMAAARLAGIPTIFVESLTRVRELSLTGRVIRRLRLAERFYVQWPELEQARTGTRYAGAVL